MIIKLSLNFASAFPNAETNHVSRLRLTTAAASYKTQTCMETQVPLCRVALQAFQQQNGDEKVSFCCFFVF